MMNRRWILTGVAAALVAAAAFGGWWFFVRDDAPPPLTLEDALVTTTTLSGEPVTNAATSTAPETTEQPTTDQQATTGSPVEPTASSAPPSGAFWSVDPSGSVVGYRIAEELAGIGGNTAVGRTSDVIGSLSLSDATIETVEIVVDMTTLTSDDSRRDGQLARRGLETNSFPEASFRLTEPIELESLPAVGEAVTALATGELTLHGVTRSVDVAIDGQFVDESTIVVVGTADIVLADYEIEAPTGFTVLSVADDGILEFQLTFRA